MNQLTNFPPQLAADIHDRGLSAEPKIFDEVARLAIFFLSNSVVYDPNQLISFSPCRYGLKSKF